MAAKRLSDSLKRELLDRYRQGATAQALARELGCSATTVSRAIRSLVSPEDYAVLKQGRSSQPVAITSPQNGSRRDSSPPVAPLEGMSADAGEDDDIGSSPGALAIEDADDFSADEPEGSALDEALSSEESTSDHPTGTEDDPSTFVLIAPVEGVRPVEPVEVHSLAGATLPSRLYMLVDKSVELEPRPLHTFSELGMLPDGEGDRPALALYASPRTAKRECSRSQKVIPLPDPQMVLRAASYLLAQGISRVVLDGRPYALDR